VPDSDFTCSFSSPSPSSSLLTDLCRCLLLLLLQVRDHGIHDFIPAFLFSSSFHATDSRPRRHGIYGEKKKAIA
jgi:hypothetical protein